MNASASRALLSGCVGGAAGGACAAILWSFGAALNLWSNPHAATLKAAVGSFITNLFFACVFALPMGVVMGVAIGGPMLMVATRTPWYGRPLMSGAGIVGGALVGLWLATSLGIGFVGVCLGAIVGLIAALVAYQFNGPSQVRSNISLQRDRDR